MPWSINEKVRDFKAKVTLSVADLFGSDKRKITINDLTIKVGISPVFIG